jgi:hypothetical protein
MPTPVEELRTAAKRLRDTRNCDGFNVDSNSRELLDMIRVLLRAREPLAKWLEDAATIHLPDNECGYCDPQHNRLGLPCPALAVARAVNAAATPGPVLGGKIVDHAAPVRALLGGEPR